MNRIDIFMIYKLKEDEQQSMVHFIKMQVMVLGGNLDFIHLYF